MKRWFLSLLLVALSGCGSDRGEESPGGAPSTGQMQPVEADLSSLDGLPLEEFIRAILPRLATEPGIQNRADFSAALAQKWKIHCEKNCRIERK